MSILSDTYLCINCGKKTEQLYDESSKTVLKLTVCPECNRVVDEYVEIDIVTVIIDLILFNTGAVRHILFNSEFKHFWKLSIILILVESYSIWTLSNPYNSTKFDPANRNTESVLKQFNNFSIEDLKFYVTVLNVTCRFLLFIVLVYFHTIFYKFATKITSINTSFVFTAKIMTLSSIGVFLQLPSIIWDLSVYDYHLHFITLYIWLNQLFMYRTVYNCSKMFSLITIFSSNFIKHSFSYVITYLSMYLLKLFHLS